MVQEQSSSHHHQHQLPRYGTGAGAGAPTGVARASKKNKPKKIPQRGLGVAQLEKLRIEEQKKMEGGAGSGPAPAAHPRALGGGGLGHLLPMHRPPLQLSALPRPAVDGGVHCGGGFTPVLWDTADPMKHPYKRSLCPQPPVPTMVSTGLSLTTSSSHPTEPPSNQMYSSSGSRSSAAPPEEDRELAGLDRSWPFMFEGMTAAAFRPTGKATPAAVPSAARTTRDAGFVCPEMSGYEFRAMNCFSTKGNYSDLASDFAHYKNSMESGCAGEPARLSLSAQPSPFMKQPHVIPSIHLPEYSDLGVMQSHQGSISTASSRPFYSFLPAGPVRRERPLGECKADVSDGVDLELKLWKS